MWSVLAAQSYSDTAAMDPLERAQQQQQQQEEEEEPAPVPAPALAAAVLVPVEPPSAQPPAQTR